MPRTEIPHKPFAGINPVINCTFCVHREKGVEVKDSDVFFSAACPRFELVRLVWCRETEHWVHWTVCSYHYYHDVYAYCSSCSIGEGLVQITNALNIKVPNKQDLKM